MHCSIQCVCYFTLRTFVILMETINDVYISCITACVHRQAEAFGKLQFYLAPVFCRRRHQPRKPPLAKIRPGRPAPAMGAGTGAEAGAMLMLAVVWVLPVPLALIVKRAVTE
jgi:hypothetical protein